MANVDTRSPGIGDAIERLNVKRAEFGAKPIALGGTAPRAATDGAAISVVSALMAEVADLKAQKSDLMRDISVLKGTDERLKNDVKKALARSDDMKKALEVVRRQYMAATEPKEKTFVIEKDFNPPVLNPPAKVDDLRSIIDAIALKVVSGNTFELAAFEALQGYYYASR